MGLDLIELQLAIEEEFKITIDASDWESLSHHGDVEVGALYFLILHKQQKYHLARNHLAVNRHLWEQTRDSLAIATGMAADQIELQTPLTTLFPRSQRRQTWESFRAESPWPVEELEYSRNVVRIGWTIAILATLAELGRLAWQIRLAAPLVLIGAFTGLWLVFESRRKVMLFLQPLQTHFPNRIQTVKDLCRQILNNHIPLLVDTTALPQSPITHNGAHWEKLITLCEEKLCVDRNEIRFNSRLVRDLGAC